MSECGRRHRDGIGKLLEDFGEHTPAGRLDFPVFAVESDLPLGVAIDEAPSAADAKVDFTDGDRVAFSQTAPPLLHMFWFGHRLEHQLPGGIEQAGQTDFPIRWCRDLKAIAICRAASYHKSSSPLH